MDVARRQLYGALDNAFEARCPGRPEAVGAAAAAAGELAFLERRARRSDAHATHILNLAEQAVPRRRKQ